ncbi:MAG: hypothetical protein EXR94_05650 [Gemmatimonadetes bacterium]|nr:hypothetical protein [Gemmatimonadota bacterium]
MAVIPVVAAVILAACNDPFAVLPASITNTVDTVEIYAVNGTALDRPSGYVIPSRSLIRIGLDPAQYNVDFLYRIDPTNGSEFVPYTVVAPPPPSASEAGRAGFLVSTVGFDAITEAEQTGFVVNKPVKLAVGQVLQVRSGLPNGCYLGIPYYAKLEVLGFDQVQRSVKFRILANVNCGYRGLEPGLPKR